MNLTRKACMRMMGSPKPKSHKENMNERGLPKPESHKADMHEKRFNHENMINPKRGVWFKYGFQPREGD